MSPSDGRTEHAAALRKHADKLATHSTQSPDDLTSLTAEEIRLRLHELQVYQIELEMQNEELRRTRNEVESAKARFFDLYDMAPVGYCTTDTQGLIREANLTVATLLGIVRDAMVRRPLSRFIFADDQDIYYLFRQQLLRTKNRQGCDLRMVHADGTTFWVRLEATLVSGADDTPECRLVISEISQRKQAEEALHASECRLRFLVQNSSDSLVIINADGTQRYVSPAAERITGFSIAELEGKAIDTLIHPDDIKDVMAAWNQAVAQPDTAVTVQYRHIHKTREWVFSEAIAQSFLNEPAINGVIVSVRDITERQMAQQKLRQHEHALKAILDASTETISLMNAEGIILIANKAMARRLHTPVEDLAGRNVFDFFPPELARRRKTRFDEVVTTGRPIVMVDQRVGDTLESSIYPVFDESGRVSRIALFASDISRRIQAEKALQKNKSLLNATQQLGRIGGWEWNVAEQSMVWTDETYHIHGIAPDDQPTLSAELIHRSLTCYLPADRPKIAEAFRRCVEAGESYDLRFPFRSANGRKMWVRTMAEPVRKGENIVLVRGNIMDITDEQQVHQLLQARLRLSEAAVSLPLEALLAEVLQEAETLTSSQVGFFHFLEADQQTLSLQAWSRSTMPHFCKAEGKGLHYCVDQAGVWGDCIRERRPVIHNDYPALPQRKGLPPGHAEVRRELVVPIFRGEMIVAVFGVGNKEQAYDQSDIDLVANLGDMAWDIVLRKQSEEDLRQSEESHRLQIELAMDGILLLSSEGVITGSNRSLCTMLDMEARAIIGQHLSKLPFTSESMREYPFRFDLLSKGETVNSDSTLIRTDGTLVSVEMRTGMMPDGTYQSIFRDITERKKAEKLIKDQVDFTRRVLDSTDAHIAILDEQGRIIDANNAWKCFGRENKGNEEAIGIGASYFCAWSPEYGDASLAAEAFEGVRQVQRGERDSFQVIYPCHSPDEDRWFTMQVQPLSGAPGQVLVSHTNITSLKKTEESLSVALAEREVLLREVHHRVKNNLAAIVGLLDMQRRIIEDPHGRNILAELGGRIRSMSLIHEKLYRAENLAQIDFQEYLQALISHLRTSFGSPRIHFQADALGVEMPLDLAVPCGMIINELVTNALKYAFPGGEPAPGNDTSRIRVEMRREDGLYRLSVADNGVGLPAGFDWSSSKTLGMVLVRMLGSHQLGGGYELDQQHGLRFTLTFSEQRGKK